MSDEIIVTHHHKSGVSILRLWYIFSIFIIYFLSNIAYIVSMEFEFDINKSKSNKEKHGIDFTEVQPLWNDPDLLEIPAKSVQDENRYLLIGKIEEKHWSAVITYRNDSVRIISVRRSREKEVEYYES